MSGGFQRRGPDVFLIEDRRHGEDVCLPGVAPGRQPCSRHRADLVEPDRERHLVGRPGAAPPPLHVGGLPHAAERICQASALQDRGRRVQPSETPQQLASHDHVVKRIGREAERDDSGGCSLVQRHTTTQQAAVVPAAWRHASASARLPKSPAAAIAAATASMAGA